MGSVNLVRLRMGQRLTGLYWSQLSGRMWKSLARGEMKEYVRVREILRRSRLDRGFLLTTADCEREIEAISTVAEQVEKLPGFARQLRLIEENLRHPHHFSKGRWRQDPQS